MRNIVEHTNLLLVNIWGLSSSQLHYEDTKGPHVDLCVVGLKTTDHFGRHPADCADLALAAIVVLSQLRCIAEISKFDLTGARYQNVVRLDISMQNVSFVQVI